MKEHVKSVVALVSWTDLATPIRPACFGVGCEPLPGVHVLAVERAACYAARASFSGASAAFFCRQLHRHDARPLQSENASRAVTIDRNIL